MALPYQVDWEVGRGRLSSRRSSCPLLGSARRAVVEEGKAMAYRILVVEDEPDTRELLEFTLRWTGHDVDIATGGREALELLAGRSYDVILSNLNMPGMSGEDLYQRIEHGWPHLSPRVVFVTAASPSDRFQAQFGGRPVPVLTKPYTRERLLKVIEDVVARDV
jgi:CheY-like chemotaxis protein